jgi:hypothetical protein
MSDSRFAKFAATIRRLPDSRPLDKTDVLTDAFLLERETFSARNGSDRSLEMYYAPFDYVNIDAQLVIVGITPGGSQMLEAFRTARDGLARGLTEGEVLRLVKQRASFGGMRETLGAWLDGIGIAEQLGLDGHGCASLFDTLGQEGSPLHTTSVFPYPVFVDGENYNGRKPRWRSSRFLQRWVTQGTAQTLRQLERVRVIFPIGVVPEEVLRTLVSSGLLDERRCVFGLPHPRRQDGLAGDLYEQNRGELRVRVKSCFAG